MKNSIKGPILSDHNKTHENRSHKHDVNLKKNSTIYFQIGLILCLLATYALFEMKFQQQLIEVVSPDYIEDSIIEVSAVYRLKPQRVERPKPKKKMAQKLTDTYRPTGDNLKTLETRLSTTEEPLDNVFEPNGIPKIEEPEESLENMFIATVQKVPVFPGCEKYSTNAKRKKCMSKKIGKLINKNFNTELGAKYGINGKQRLYTQFTIDSDGEVKDIKVRAPHTVLEKEAERVIRKIPKMQPGFQGDKPVGVIYTLPISFIVD